MERQDRTFERAARPTHATASVAAQAKAELDVARTLCQAALFAFREQVRKGACEQRVRDARVEMVVWRERMESLLQQKRR